MKKDRFFLWPSGNTFSAILSMYRLISERKIEEELQELFQGAYPVLCTSGRAAIYMSLSEMGVSRKDYVGVFPYASYCVLDSVSRVTTPLMGTGWLNSVHRIVYHQWGYVQEWDLSPETIEDCVDTLCVPGTALFPSGGNFEIWSLPKILGTTSGAILWCKDAETAKRIRDKRDSSSGGTFQWLLRLLSRFFPSVYDYWNGAEAGYRKLSVLQTGEIWVAIHTWDKLVKDRKQKLEQVWPLAVNWLSKPSNRLPSVIPIFSEMPDNEIVELGIEHGYRMIEKINPDGSRKLVRVLPVPIHQDVPAEWITKTLNIITQYVSPKTG